MLLNKLFYKSDRPLVLYKTNNDCFFIVQWQEYFHPAKDVACKEVGLFIFHLIKIFLPYHCTLKLS